MIVPVRHFHPENGMIDWDKVLQNVSWFHFSAICPASAKNVADVCDEALAAAERRGITISVDLNYRAKFVAVRQIGGRGNAPPG